MTINAENQKNETHRAESFELMQYTTEHFVNQLVHLWTRLGKEYPQINALGYGLFVFGSPKRVEMLPQSDIDLVVISPESPTKDCLRNIIVNQINELPYDKPDIPPWHSINDMELYANIGSPEGDYADAKLVIASPAVRQAYKESRVSDIFASCEHLARKLVFHHYFFDYRYRGKITAKGINLKYSPGATRDLIYFDWYHDLQAVVLKNAQPRRNNLPQLEEAIQSLCDEGMVDESEFRQLARAIDFVVFTKHAVLELLRDTASKGKGYMNFSTANALLAYYPDFYQRTGGFTPQALQIVYDRSRTIIYNVRKRIFESVVQRFGQAQDLQQMIALWEAIISGNTKQVKLMQKQIRHSTDWHFLAALLTSDQIDPMLIHELATGQATMPGYEYLNRLIIKNMRTSPKTLRMLLQAHSLALSTGVDLEYRNMIINRLKHEAP